MIEATIKANELVEQYLQVVFGNKGAAKQCALIAVDLAIKITFNENEFDYRYWKDVRSKIEKYSI